MATEIAVETQHNFIGGKWVPAASGADLRGPQPGRPRRPRRASSRRATRDVEAAVAAAKKAFPGWKNTPAPRRAEVLYAAGEILKRDKEKLARLMTREMGKVLAETRGDVQEAIDMAFLAAGEGRRLFGFTTPVGAAEQVRHVRAPAGRRLRLRDALELPDGDPGVEVHGRADRGQHDRHQAGDRHAGVGRRARARLRGGGASGRRLQRRHGLGRRGRRSAGPAPRRQGRLVHRLDRGRPAASRRPARRRSSACTWRWAARTRSSSWTTRTWTWPSTAPSGARSARPGSAARRRRGCSCTRRSTATFSREARRRASRRSRSATASTRRSTWGRASRRSSARRWRSTSRSARPRARGS